MSDKQSDRLIETTQVIMMVSCDLQAALGTVVPDEADIRWINTCSNEHIQVLVDNVFQLFNHITFAVKHKRRYTTHSLPIFLMHNNRDCLKK